MNKVYIIFPLIGILIFGGIYVNFHKHDEARIAAAKAKVEANKIAKTHQQDADRKTAIDAAIKAQAAQKILREERERTEEAKRVARQDAEDRRMQSHADAQKFRDQVLRLKRELGEVKEATVKVVDEKKRFSDEEVFLKSYLKQAEANTKYYYDLLDKITAAEKAAEQAAAAAAAAAKKA